ncbi:unnamed protein product [Cunninghamella blakesleeana]
MIIFFAYFISLFYFTPFFPFLYCFFFPFTMLPTTLLHFKSKTTITNFNDGYLSKINGIEDLLRALVLILPGRVSDGDLCSQAILTVLNLVSLANTNLLYKSANKKKLFAAALKQHDKNLKEKKIIIIIINIKKKRMMK